MISNWIQNIELVKIFLKKLWFGFGNLFFHWQRQFDGRPPISHGDTIPTKTLFVSVVYVPCPVLLHSRTVPLFNQPDKHSLINQFPFQTMLPLFLCTFNYPNLVNANLIKCQFSLCKYYYIIFSCEDLSLNKTYK